MRLMNDIYYAFAALTLLTAATAQAAEATPRSSAEILAASSPEDWRRISEENLMVLQLPKGKVLIELAPAFAPRHVANVKALVRERYFDGLSVLRVQDNYVAQWGDPESHKPIRSAQASLPAEFFQKLDAAIAFTPLGETDAYAPETGFSNGLPAVRDVSKGETWLAHCYGMVGAGRGEALDSGGGTELYAVIGHAPRHLDRNVTLLGRVVQGIEQLSSLPRGTGALGFYEKPAQRVPLQKVRMAADLPAAKRPALEALRTDTATWAAFVAARRSRHEAWFAEPTDHIEVCNVPLPIRTVAAPAKK